MLQLIWLKWEIFFLINSEVSEVSFLDFRILLNSIRTDIFLKWECTTNIKLYFFEETLSGSPQEPVIFTLYDIICKICQTFVIVRGTLQHYVNWFSFWTLQWTVSENLILFGMIFLERKKVVEVKQRYQHFSTFLFHTDIATMDKRCTYGYKEMQEKGYHSLQNIHYSLLSFSQCHL